MVIEFIEKTIIPLVGIGLILMYAFDRFNTPPSNRALTTAARYYVAASAYMMLYLLAYSILLYYPDLMNWLLKIANENIEIPKSIPTAVIGAILLSIVIPKLPGFHKLDSKLRKLFQNLAAIPFQALKLSGDIQEAGFSIPKKAVEKIKKDMLEHGFDERDLIFEESDTAEYLWLKNTALILQIESWGQDDRFIAFFNERHGQFTRLNERYKRLRAMALNCFSLSRQIAGDETENPMIKSVNKVYVNFKDQTEDLFREICNFISQGILKCQLTHGSRCRELGSMGFQQSDDKRTRPLNIHHVFTLSGILLILLLSNFILIAPGTWATGEKTLLMVAMIVSIYSLAVYCAIFPKEKHAFFRRDEGDYPPVAGYIISGLAAVLITIPVNLLFKTLIFLKGDPGLHQALILAWNSFISFSYPWMFMAFVTAAITSFLSDYGTHEKIPEIWWRFLQAILQSGLTVLAAIFVRWWLQDIYPVDRELPNKTAVVVISAAVGFTLGFIIPSWYRQAHENECKFGENESVTQDLNLAHLEGSRYKQITNLDVSIDS